MKIDNPNAEMFLDGKTNDGIFIECRFQKGQWSVIFSNIGIVIDYVLDAGIRFIWILTGYCVGEEVELIR